MSQGWFKPWPNWFIQTILIKTSVAGKRWFCQKYVNSEWENKHPWREKQCYVYIQLKIYKIYVWRTICEIIPAVQGFCFSKLSWKPSFARSFFDPLNLEFVNKAKNIPMVIGAQELWSEIQTNRQKKITTSRYKDTMMLKARKKYFQVIFLMILQLANIYFRCIDQSVPCS